MCNFVVAMIDPTLYSININPVAWAALGVMVLCLLLIALIWWPKMWRIRRKMASDNAKELPEEGYPAVSVIVYSHADGENLRTLLPQILEQDYPAPMEVIVVNDESSDDTETIVGELELTYPNLYMTFVPERSRSLSRRKLSITLGIKAARYDALLLTHGNCRVESPRWIRSMMAPMIGGRKEVVIGYATPWGDDAPDTDRRRRRRAFDDMWHSVRMLSNAIVRRPIMATGYNLAYTRSLFFKHKGFSKTLIYNYGDDDMFITEIANRRNTAVVLSDDARVKSLEYAPAQFHDTYRMRRDFTSQFLPRRSFRSMGFTSVLWWLWPIFGAVAVWFSLPSLIVAAAVALLAITFTLVHGSKWRKTARCLGLRPLFFTVPWLAWHRPLRTLRHKIRGKRNRKSNLTQVVSAC